MLLGDNTPGYVWRVPWDCSPVGKHAFGCAGQKHPLDTTALNVRDYGVLPHAPRDHPAHVAAARDARSVVGRVVGAPAPPPLPWPTDRAARRVMQLVMVREPIARAYSHFSHFQDPADCENRKKTPECFHTQAVAWAAELTSCLRRHAPPDPHCAFRPTNKDAWKMTLRTLSLGLYALFLTWWLRFFDKSGFCVLDLSDFHHDGADGGLAGIDRGMQLIHECVGLTPRVGYEAEAINRRGTKVAPPLNTTVALLGSVYAPFNRELCRLDFQPLGCRPDWLAIHRDAVGEPASGPS